MCRQWSVVYRHQNFAGPTHKISSATPAGQQVVYTHCETNVQLTIVGCIIYKVTQSNCFPPLKGNGEISLPTGNIRQGPDTSCPL